MASVLLALSAEMEDRLIPQLLDDGHEVVARCMDSAGCCHQIEAQLPSLAVVGAAATVLTGELRDTADTHGTRLVVVASSAEERSRAAALGLLEVVSQDADWTAVEQALRLPGATDAIDPVRAEVDTPVVRSRGQVIAVWGPVGSPGRSTVATTIAAELVLVGRRVALVDADTHGASLAVALGLLDEAPGFAAACRLAGAGALTSAELDRIAQRHEVGGSDLMVLTGIARTNRWPELTPARVTGVLDACRAWVDVTVVDMAASLEQDEEISSDLFAPRRNGATLTVLRAADEVVAVGSADPVGVSRFLRGYAELIDVVDPPRVHVVMNAVRSSAIGASPSAQLARTLLRFGGIMDCDFVPYDRDAVDDAVLVGRTIPETRPKSPLRHAVTRLVTDRFLPKPAGRRPRRALLPARTA